MSKKRKGTDKIEDEAGNDPLQDRGARDEGSNRAPVVKLYWGTTGPHNRTIPDDDGETVASKRAGEGAGGGSGSAGGAGGDVGDYECV